MKIHPKIDLFIIVYNTIDIADESSAIMAKSEEWYIWFRGTILQFNPNFFSVK